MILSISAPQFDIDGSELLHGVDEAPLQAIRRRVSRTPTLDGGAAINDFGYSDSDRTLDIRWPARDRVQADNIARMVKAYSRLIISMPEGVFVGAPESFDPQSEELQLTILVEKRIDQ